MSRRSERREAQLIATMTSLRSTNELGNERLSQADWILLIERASKHRQSSRRRARRHQLALRNPARGPWRLAVAVALAGACAVGALAVIASNRPAGQDSAPAGATTTPNSIAPGLSVPNGTQVAKLGDVPANGVTAASVRDSIDGVRGGKAYSPMTVESSLEGCASIRLEVIVQHEDAIALRGAASAGSLPPWDPDNECGRFGFVGGPLRTKELIVPVMQAAPSLLAWLKAESDAKDTIVTTLHIVAGAQVGTSADARSTVILVLWAEDFVGTNHT